MSEERKATGIVILISRSGLFLSPCTHLALCSLSLFFSFLPELHHHYITIRSHLFLLGREEGERKKEKRVLRRKKERSANDDDGVTVHPGEWQEREPVVALSLLAADRLFLPPSLSLFSLFFYFIFMPCVIILIPLLSFLCCFSCRI